MEGAPRQEGQRRGSNQWRSQGLRLGGSEMKKVVRWTLLQRSIGFREANVEFTCRGSRVCIGERNQRKEIILD